VQIKLKDLLKGLNIRFHLRQYKDTKKTPVNLARRGENWRWFEVISKELIGMFYTADVCVCLCVRACHNREIIQNCYVCIT
jgi:hypothetical protein